MVNNPTFRQVIDSGTGVTFAVVVSDGSSMRAHGSMKQGRDWASWANGAKLNYEQLVSSLDPGLEVGPSMALTEENLSLVSDSITPSTMRELTNMIPVVVAVVSTKSEQQGADQAEHDPEDEPEFELLENWPITEVSLSLFDVQLKRDVVNYKAGAFLAQKDYASLVSQVKALDARFVDGQWVARPKLLDDRAHLLGKHNRRKSMRLFSELDKQGYFEKMVPIGAARFNTNPMTARDADKDRLVLEGIPWVNMGRGIPDPTPFGSSIVDREGMGGIRAFGGKLSAMGRSSNRQVRRTRRAVDKARESAKRNVADEISWISSGGTEPTASMAGRLRRRLADYVASVGDSIAGESEATPVEEEEVITRRQRRRMTEAAERTPEPSRPPIKEIDESVERVRQDIGDTPTTPKIVDTATERLASAEEQVTTSGTSPMSRSERGTTPRPDGDSIARRLSKRISRISKRINSTESPNPKPTKPQAKPTEPQTVSQIGDRFLVGDDAALKNLSDISQTYAQYDPSVASDRFGATQIPFSSYSPQDQRLLLNAMDDARRELFNRISEVLKETIYDEDGSVLRAPYIPEDTEVDATSIRDMVASGIKNGNIFTGSSALSPFNNGFFDSIRSLIAMDDMLADRWSNPSRNRDDDFFKIDNRARVFIQTAADVGDRGFTTGRIQGRTGERTVLRTAADSSTKIREVSLSKIQPRRLMIQSSPRATESDGSPVVPFSNYSGVQQSALMVAADALRKSIGSEFRTLAGLGNTDEITEDIVDNLLLASRSAADPNATQRLSRLGHAVVVLDDMLEDMIGNPTRNRDMEWASLDSQTRQEILTNSNINAVPSVPKATTKKPSGRTARRPVTPPTPPATPVVTTPSAPESVQEQTETPTENARASVIDAAQTMVSLTDEDGNVRQVPLNTLGRANQYDFDNIHLDAEGTPYVHENATRLYRNPVTGDYLEDYSQVEVTVDRQIPKTEPLQPVQISKKAGQIVSYPQVTLDSSNSPRYRGLSQLDSDQKNGPLTIGDILTEVLGVDAQQVKELLGKKFYLAPGVKAGSSTNNWRQAALLLLATSNHEIPTSEKRQLQMIDVVDVPQGSDSTEAYLRYAGLDDLAAEYVAGGRDASFIKPSDDTSTYSRRFAPPHLQNFFQSAPWRSSSLRVFSDNDENNRYRYVRTIVPGMTESVSPRAGKMLVLWRHPMNFDGYYYGSGNGTQLESVVQSVNKALETDRPEDWYAAFNNVVSAYTSAISAANSALTTWRGLSGARSRNPRPKRDFVMNSELAETFEKILVDIFRPNMNKVADSVRRERQQQSRTMNAVGRIRRKASQSGIKNVGGLEDSQLFVPLGPNGESLPPRSPDDVLALVDAHRATGFLPEVPSTVRPDDPMELEELSDDAITMLSGIALASQQAINVVDGSPIGSANNVGSSRKAAEIASLHFSGGLGKPIQVSEEEYKLLAGSSQDEVVFVPNFYPIRRGIRSPKAGTTTHQMAQDLISGPYYVPAGEGAAAGGFGLNFDAPGGYSGYSSGDQMGDITIGLLPRSARVISRGQLETLKNQVEIMSEAFMSRIGYDDGVARDLPIDTGLDNSDFQHDNIGNPSYDPQRPDSGFGYFAPWYGATSNGNMRGPATPDMMSAASRSLWGQLSDGSVSEDMTITGTRTSLATVPDMVDSTDAEALRTLASTVMTAALQNPTWSWSDDDPSDPLPGSEWFKRTRAQVFGWFVQLEILKGMEIAKLKAEGKVPWSERIAELVRAQKTILYSNDHVVMATLLGVDAYDSQGKINITTKNPDLIMKQLWDGAGNAHIMVVNRTALVMLRNPVTTGTQDQIVEGIYRPITDPNRPGMVFNPYNEQWIPDPRVGGQ